MAKLCDAFSDHPTEKDRVSEQLWIEMAESAKDLACLAERPRWSLVKIDLSMATSLNKISGASSQLLQ